jgi:hypothetical protein
VGLRRLLSREIIMPRFAFSSALAWCAVLAGGVFAPAGAADDAKRPPNILLLIADDKAYNEAVPRGSAVRNAILRNKSAILCLTANW